MPIYSLTFEKVQELKNQLKDKQTEYQKLKKLTPKQIWKNELNQLLKEYNKWREEKKKEEEMIPSKKITKKKVTSKKKNISI